MTIGIALKDKKQNRIILGSDKQVTIGDNIKTTINGSKTITKEIRIVDGYYNHIDTKKIYFLFAGQAFLQGYIENILEIPDIQENQNFIEYLYNDLLDCLREQLLEKKLLGTRNDKFKSESNVVIIYDGEIYELDGNFGVNHIKEYTTIGSGWQVAIGSLYTNLHYHPYTDAADIVKQAIITSGVNTIYCDTNADITIIEL